jgi:hypothetical protein
MRLPGGVFQFIETGSILADVSECGVSVGANTRLTDWIRRWASPGRIVESNRGPELAADGSFPRPRESPQPSVPFMGCRCATNSFEQGLPYA